MSIYRTETDLDIADVEGTETDTILSVNVCHYAALSDTVETLLSDSSLLRHGQELTFAGFSGWYVTKTNLRYFATDAISKQFTQEVEISRLRPTLKSTESNPLLRAVRRVRATVSFESQPAVIDAAGNAVINAVGEWMSGFSVQVPITELHYEWNSSTLPQWLISANGCLNAQPITIGTITVGKFCAQLIVDEYPLPDNVKSEGGVNYYPLFWRLRIDPRTHLDTRLHQGFHEWAYVDVNGDRVSPTAAPGSAAGQLYKRKKKAILDDIGEPLKQQGMLDYWGRSIRNVALTNTPVGSVETTSGSSAIVRASGTFDESDRGLMVGIYHSSYPAGFLSTIESVSGSSATVASAVPFTAAAATLYKPGISTKSFLKSPIADFAALGVPL